jgi:hypothetical protein
MKYLYGDSTPSTLGVNFIEFLRDGVDFCVQVLLADQRIAQGHAHTRSLEHATAAELERLQKLPPLVTKAFDGFAVGAADSATARCVAAISHSAGDLARAEAVTLRSVLDAEIAKRDTQAGHERDACVKALETLLVKHDLPDTTQDIHVVVTGEGRHVCRARVKAGSGLEAIVDLEIPADHLFDRVVRVDRLTDRLDVQAPEIAGWLHKEVKQRTQHLDKHHVVELLIGPGGGTIKLRAAADGTGPGFDVLFSPQVPRVRMVRVEQRDGAPEPPFDVEDVDAQKLLALYEKLAAAATALAGHRRKLIEAKIDGEPMRTHAKPTLLVERLIAAIAPVVQEISSRSQSPGELVLRRLLSGDRREEIFVSKTELKLKLEPLEDRNRALFEPLWSNEHAPVRSATPAPVKPAAPAPQKAAPEPPAAETPPPPPRSSPTRIATPASGVQPPIGISAAPPPTAAAPTATNAAPLGDIFRRTLLGTTAQVEPPPVPAPAKPPAADPARMEAAGTIEIKRPIT